MSERARARARERGEKRDRRRIDSRTDQKRRAKWELTSVRLTGLMDEGTRYFDDASRRRVVDRLADTRTSPHLGHPRSPRRSLSLSSKLHHLLDVAGDLIPCDVRNMERPPTVKRDSHLEETFIQPKNRESPSSSSSSSSFSSSSHGIVSCSSNFCTSPLDAALGLPFFASYFIPFS